jgi:hypothetical protein
MAEHWIRGLLVLLAGWKQIRPTIGRHLCFTSLVLIKLLPEYIGCRPFVEHCRGNGTGCHTQHNMVQRAAFEAYYQGTTAGDRAMSTGRRKDVPSSRSRELRNPTADAHGVICLSVRIEIRIMAHYSYYVVRLICYTVSWNGPNICPGTMFKPATSPGV